jgi:hypothetical protein
MRVVGIFLSFVVCCTLFTSVSGAAVILSFGAPQTFASNSGIQSINVFANSTIGAGESASSIGADFDLSGVAIFNTPNAGTFGGVGFLGNGNIITGSSSFDRDPGLSNTGYLNINFSAPQTVSSAATPLATLLVDTTGLASGTYSINATNGFFGLGTISNATGSFTIAAIPEPTSMALLSLAIGGVVGRRLLRRRSVSSTSL